MGWYCRRVVAPAALLALVCGCGAGCSSGVMHTVRPGENLYRIGKAYGIPYMRLSEVNNVGPPYTINPGDRIFVPGATRTLPVGVITPRSVNPAQPLRTSPKRKETRSV
ncbi:MAG: LysM peptidoglycan-binding domain-containing protein, partial [Candidatus Binatia bacterium]